MPRTAEDVETYLLQLDRPYESDAGTLIVSTGTDLPPVAIRVVPPIVAIRVSIGAIPADASHQLALFRRLLQLNGTDLMHTSYAIENDSIVLSAALQLDNLDKNELEAT